ncbi:SUKH-4 family immunity protein [Streptacidiphilus sp. N1-3]|uniref:SUKH-4 family immunity protein n=1 Tax=Streptacidiphilus alkalitolerans TaxID=3342712 RepID=A0ABV6WTP3_9ACTN
MHNERQWINGSCTYSGESLAGLPEELVEACRGGLIPTRFFHYFRADPAIERVPDSEGRDLTRIGFSLSGDYIVVGSKDGNLLQVDSVDLHTVSVVNSSLNAFVAFMSLCEERYPYYSDAGEGDFEVSIAASEQLGEELTPLDPGALVPGTYWSDFLSDVANGDYAEVVDEE